MFREGAEERSFEEAGPPEAEDTLSLAQIYEAYMAQVYRFIYRQVGNREDAEDLTAQVFLKAIRSLDRTRDEASIRGWLFQTARTTLADHWRQFYRTPLVSLEFFPRLRSSPSRTADDPLSHEGVERILALLPEHYRRVLTLRFLEGLSIKETAAEMGITETNVKVLQFRALRRAAELAREQK
jgi:RNA polymerase sigma-70 factor (ECF subfamily)